MKHALLMILMIFAVSLSLSAAQVNCSTITSLSQLVTAGTGSNYVSNGDSCLDQDKLYSNWFYNPGTGDPAPSSVDLDIFFNANVNGLDYHYVTLTAVNTAWASTVTWGYTITVVPETGQPDRYISFVEFDISGAPGADGSKTLQITGVPDVILGDGTGASVNATQINVSVTGIPVGSGINNFRDTYTQGVVPQIPEPSTYALFGGGLLALGFLRRRRK